MEMPLRFSLSLCMRKRVGALVLPTARLPRDSAGAIHPGNARARIFHGKVLRRAVYRVLRAASGDPRQLARPADAEAHIDGPAARGFGADRLFPRPFVIRSYLHSLPMRSFQLAHRYRSPRLTPSASVLTIEAWPE